MLETEDAILTSPIRKKLFKPDDDENKDYRNTSPKKKKITQKAPVMVTDKTEDDEDLEEMFTEKSQGSPKNSQKKITAAPGSPTKPMRKSSFAPK